MPVTTLSVREAPYLSLSGAVKYITASSAVQRERILSEFKHPEPDGKAMRAYYSPARDAIRRYHNSGNDLSVLKKDLDALERLELGASTEQAASKLANNVRALKGYSRHFGNKSFRPIKLDTPTVSCEGVELSLHPDMDATEGSHKRLIKYDFSKEAMSRDELNATLYLLYFLAKQMELDIAPSDCMVLSVSDGVVHKMQGTLSSYGPKLKAAMREVKRSWSDL